MAKDSAAWGEGDSQAPASAAWGEGDRPADTTRLGDLIGQKNADEVTRRVGEAKADIGQTLSDFGSAVKTAAIEHVKNILDPAKETEEELRAVGGTVLPLATQFAGTVTGAIKTAREGGSLSDNIVAERERLQSKVPDLTADHPEAAAQASLLAAPAAVPMKLAGDTTFDLTQSPVAGYVAQVIAGAFAPVKAEFAKSAARAQAAADAVKRSNDQIGTTLKASGVNPELATALQSRASAHAAENGIQHPAVHASAAVADTPDQDLRALSPRYAGLRDTTGLSETEAKAALASHIVKSGESAFPRDAWEEQEKSLLGEDQPAGGLTPQETAQLQDLQGKLKAEPNKHVQAVLSQQIKEIESAVEKRQGAARLREMGVAALKAGDKANSDRYFAAADQLVPPPVAEAAAAPVEPAEPPVEPAEPPGETIDLAGGAAPQPQTFHPGGADAAERANLPGAEVTSEIPGEEITLEGGAQKALPAPTRPILTEGIAVNSADKPEDMGYEPGVAAAVAAHAEREAAAAAQQPPAAAQAEANSRASQEASAAVRGPPITPEAESLLDTVDKGGVPFAITKNLRRIASENGIEVTGKTSPSDVIDQLRKKRAADQEAHAVAQAGAAPLPDGSKPAPPARLPIDASKDVPLTGSLNRARNTALIDRSLPRWVIFDRRGKVVGMPSAKPAGKKLLPGYTLVDAHDVVAQAHEAPEGRRLSGGEDYDAAHGSNRRGATKYENDYVRTKYGLDPKHWQKWINAWAEDHLKRANRGDLTDIHTDLDPAQYVGDNAKFLTGDRNEQQLHTAEPASSGGSSPGELRGQQEKGAASAAERPAEKPADAQGDSGRPNGVSEDAEKVRGHQGQTGGRGQAPGGGEDLSRQDLQRAEEAGRGAGDGAGARQKGNALSEGVDNGKPGSERAGSSGDTGGKGPEESAKGGEGQAGGGKNEKAAGGAGDEEVAQQKQGPAYPDPPAEHSAAIEEAAKSGSMITLAQHIADHAPNPADRIIARRVKQTLNRLALAGVKLRLSVAHVGDTVPASLVNSRGITQHRFGGDDPNTHVWLNGSDVTGKVGTSYETALHELVHAATMSAIRLGNDRAALGSKLAGHVADLFDVSRAVIDHFNNRVKEANAGGAPLTDFEQSIYKGQRNALRDQHEIIAWGLTNREMQRYLESIHYPGRQTLWSKFVSGIRNLLGLPANGDTALSEVLRVSDEILNHDVQKLQEHAVAAGTAMQIQSERGVMTAEQKDESGLAHRIGEARGTEAERGDAASKEESLAHGEKLLGAGIDPHKFIRDAVANRTNSYDAFTVAAAHAARLDRAANMAADKFGDTSPEYQKALDAEAAWRAETKPLQTLWSEQGLLQQGSPIDVSTVEGMRKAYSQSTGKAFTPRQKERATKISDEVKEADKAVDEAQKKVAAAADPDAPRDPKFEELKDKLRTDPDKVGYTAEIIRNRKRAGATPEEIVETVHNAGADQGTIDKAWERVRKRDPKVGLGDAAPKAKKVAQDAAARREAAIKAHKPGEAWKPEESAALWKEAKARYFDKGNYNFDDVRAGLAATYGLPMRDITEGLASSKAQRVITNDMYQKMADRRRVVDQAKEWLSNQKYPMWQNILRNVPKFFFNLSTFGHGTVGMITHAGNQMFNPAAVGTYWSNFFKQFPLMLSKGYHQNMMVDLVRDSNYTIAKRAGLANDPFKFQDDYQNSGTLRFMQGIKVAGNRGFDALKLFRQERFNQRWDALPEDLKTPLMAKYLADMGNHETGVVTRQGRASIANVPPSIMFAPKLEASRWSFLIGDPARAAKTFANWSRETPEARRAAMMEIRQKASLAATYMGALAVNQGFLTATGSDESVNFTDPSKADWLAFKGAGHKVGIVSPMLGSIRFLVDMASYPFEDARQLRGESPEAAAARRAEKYMRTKLAPFASLVTDAYSGSDYQQRPLPWSDRPVPKYLQREGIDKYTYGEYAGEHLLPIPAEEALTEKWREDGASDEQISHWLGAIAAGVIVGGTGAHISDDTQVKK